jgi:methylenetetrahydrofolate dehydrogenase (NADP+)/methenyltetrahydrofolate cyclohydrolase
MAEILKGVPVSNRIKLKLTEQIASIGQTITLGIIRVGQKPDDLYYQNSIQKMCAAIGMHCQIFEFKEDIQQSILQAEIDRMANDDRIDGLLMFAPLPHHLNSAELANRIPPTKDVDGLNVYSAGALYTGDQNAFPPCTPAACLALLKFYDIPLEGKHCVIVGRSLTVGKPLCLLLLNENATVTLCHSKTKSLSHQCQQADILITAAGKANLITSAFVREGQTVLDVGINPDPEHLGRYCGDVNFAEVAPIVKQITPVPGGIGSITTAILSQHTFEAFQKKNKKT